jgi:predicted TIM-barrel fold metal-dependent hydrolase
MTAPPNAALAGWDCHVHVFDAAAPALPGHYSPATRTLAEIEAHAAAEGVGHLVLVQPSVYGHDNSLLLRTLQAGDGRHRGVAVLSDAVTDHELDTLHAAGVRGMRFNRVSPVGRSQHPAQTLHRLAPRLRERGWHVQWYVQRHELAAVQALQTRHGLVFVFDHLAGMGTDTTDDDPAWQALAQLAAGGAWVKLSGWYRLNAARPYDTLHAALRRVATLFGARCVWGSDWPHTGQPDGDTLPYAALWQPLQAVLGAAAAQSVRQQHPLQLYA